VVLKELRELGDGARAVLGRHALDTSTDTNVDHARLQSVGNVNDGLQTARTLSVQGLDSSSLGETSHEGGGTELGSTTTGRQDGADSNILDGVGVDTTLVDHGLEDTSKQVSSSSVLEATLATLGQGSPQSTCHDDIIGVFLGDGGSSLLAGKAEVGGDLVQALLSWR
jgi:hypothetical protein